MGATGTDPDAVRRRLRRIEQPVVECPLLPSIPAADMLLRRLQPA
jgi:hypothetical protein